MQQNRFDGQYHAGSNAGNNNVTYAPGLNMPTCKQCGNILTTGKTFCGKCGWKSSNVELRRIAKLLLIVIIVLIIAFLLVSTTAIEFMYLFGVQRAIRDITNLTPPNPVTNTSMLATIPLGIVMVICSVIFVHMIPKQPQLPQLSGNLFRAIMIVMAIVTIVAVGSAHGLGSYMGSVLPDIDAFPETFVSTDYYGFQIHQSVSSINSINIIGLGIPAIIYMIRAVRTIPK